MSIRIACVLLAALVPTIGSPVYAREPARNQLARGRFLVANRTLLDPNFSETVVLLLDYEPRGAMGIVINRPTNVLLETALPDVKELRGRRDFIHFGGPVGLNLVLTLVRAAARPGSSQPIFSDVYATGSSRALKRASAAKGKPNRLRIYAGHAGWGPGQLDAEVARGDWYVTDADAATVFETPAARIWLTLIEHLSGEWTERRFPSEATGRLAALQPQPSAVP